VRGQKNLKAQVPPNLVVVLHISQQFIQWYYFYQLFVSFLLSKYQKPAVFTLSNHINSITDSQLRT